ncbi:hypothetical protein [Streptomyces olivochromogenes]|uniref:hypothetical protein n=1 Tax=Streptomyces olivochromogenes TaxID=1963 RepID=UPI001F2EE749|nr:hypothetical protein [Streptomyces olivochromogenes]MCF3131070.1 hypothetical protein [Streptomyces olivochromogenes]
MRRRLAAAAMTVLAGVALGAGGEWRPSAHDATLSYAVAPGRADAGVGLGLVAFDGQVPVAGRAGALDHITLSMGSPGHGDPGAGDPAMTAPGPGEPEWDHHGKGVAQDIGGWISLAAVLIAAAVALLGGRRRAREG